jgi:hypothetical protein
MDRLGKPTSGAFWGRERRALYCNSAAAEHDARGCTPGEDDEPNDPPSGPTDCLSATPQCGGTRYVRAVS